MYEILTWGYSGQLVDDLARYLTATGALLADIRYKPFSRRPEWDGRALLRRFGADYRHFACLGNRNYAGDGPILLDQPAWAINPITESLRTRPVLLLCVCRDWGTCHRKQAAEYLQIATGVPVRHLPARLLAGETAVPA